MKYIEWNGEIKSLTELSKEYGINYFTFYQRLYRGWDVKTALTYPTNKKHPYRKSIFITEAIRSGCQDVTELAERFKISTMTVYKYLGFGRPHGPRDDGRSKTFAIIKDLEESKLTQSEIAKKHGVSRQAVSNVKFKYCNNQRGEQ